MGHAAREEKDDRRRRPIVVPTFGRQLRELRGGRSRGLICKELLAYGVTLDRSTLLQYERGTVGSPDPGALMALCRLYRVALEDLVLVLMRDRSGIAIVGRDLRAPALSDEQTRVATIFGQLDDDTRRAVVILLDKMAAQQVVTVRRGRPRNTPRIVELGKK